MAKTVLRRVAETAEILESMLGARPSLEDLHVDRYDPSTGWFKIRVYLGEDTLVDIYESHVEGSLYRYSYALIIGDKRILGYDNAPHHPGVETFPRHRHVAGRVEPLEDPSLEAFLEEARKHIEHGRAGHRHPGRMYHGSPHSRDKEGRRHHPM